MVLANACAWNFESQADNPIVLWQAKIEALSATSRATRVAVQSQQRAVILQEVVNAPKARSPTFNTSLHESER
jgi:hypothetical protein